MNNYGEAYQRELERAKLEVKAAKRGLKATFDVHKTFEKFERMLEDLRHAGAPVAARPPVQTATSTYSLTMTIGVTDYEVIFFNDAIKVFWRGRDKTPMIYDALSPSRLNALARVVIERAVASALAENQRPMRTSRVVKFPQG